MSFADTRIDRIEDQFKQLSEDVNRTSASTRNSWIFFLAIQAYFFVALAGLRHVDLLRATPVPLPLLQVEIALESFFLFGPFIFVLVHMGILLQHVMLARQARELHERISNFEGPQLFRNHRIRFHVHPYSYTQLIVGGRRSSFFAFFLSLLTWVSLGILPIILLLDFQITFLPYHDLTITWAHRAYLLADLIILIVFAVFMRYPLLSFLAGFGRTILERPLSVIASFFLSLGAVFFSFSVATIPHERMDVLMTSLWPAAIADERGETGQPREAFALTALLFDGGVDILSGQPASPFGRNLVVTDTDLVKDTAIDPGEVSLNLRMRDLRYATFDRSDLHQADFTGALLTGASLRETNLVEMKAEKVVLQNADLWRAGFIPEQSRRRPVKGIDLRGADLRGADLSQTNLQGANLAGALFERAILPAVTLDSSVATEAERQGAILK